MSLNRAVLGRSYDGSATYEVGREKIREFARAIGATSPLHHSVEDAQAAGYPDVIAPPTFAIVVVARIAGQGRRDPDLGLDMRVVVHGEQHFEHERPIHAGDVLTSQEEVVAVTEIGAHELVRIRTALRSADGCLVCTATTTLISRGTAAAPEANAPGSIRSARQDC